MVDRLVDEVRGADLGDERLNERLVRIVERFGESPNLSIPAATTSRAKMEAVYRFFSNEKVSSQRILAPPCRADAAENGRPACRAVDSGYNRD